MQRKSRTLLSTVGTIFAIVLIFVIYTYGWHVTEIDLVTLITDISDVKPIVTALVQPSILAQESFQEKQRTNLWVPCPASPDMVIVPSAEGPTIELGQECASIGDTITAVGRGFNPNTEGTIRWVVVNSPSYMARLTTDAAGGFEYTFTVPEVKVGADGLRCGVEFVALWSDGPLKPSMPLKLTIEKMIETIFLALMATTLGIFVAIPLSFLGARNLVGKSPAGLAVYYATRTFFNILRSIEPLIMAIVFAVWVGIGPFAGVLALAMHSIASLGKLYSEAIESIDEGPIEAVTSTGANRLQTIFYAVIPQIVPQYLAFTIYRWDINVRMSTIIGFVGGGGIGFVLQQWINLLQYRNAAVAVWAIAIVVATLDWVSAKVREKII
jgi:phosphonate transport system permease protein